MTMLMMVLMELMEWWWLVISVRVKIVIARYLSKFSGIITMI